MSRRMFLEDYDSVRIISLPDRLDRRRAMARHLESLRVNSSSFAFADGVRTDDYGKFWRPGSHGAFLAYRNVISEAARKGESVLVLQDDCRFLPGIENFVLPQCDIFFGGRDNAENVQVGAQCVGFSRKAVRLLDAYLHRYLDDDFAPDPIAAADPGYDPAIRPPIDGALVWFRRAHPQLKCYYHRLAVQRPSRSNITPGWFDRIPGVATIAEWMRGFR